MTVIRRNNKLKQIQDFKPPGKNTTSEQKLAMITWLKVEENFKLITGSAGLFNNI